MAHLFGLSVHREITVQTWPGKKINLLFFGIMDNNDKNLFQEGW